MDFYVYLHRRATDGKIFYVGKGRYRRAYEKGYRNPHWHRTVAKHGYTIEFAQTGMQEWWAFELEIELIALYGRENLVNMTDGGDGASGWKMSDERKAAMSKLHKGKKVPRHIVDHVTRLITGKKRTQETKDAIGRWHSGKIVSAETRAKMSLHMKGRVIQQHVIDSHVEASSKPIICSNGMEFRSTAKAVEWLKSTGINPVYGSGISRCLNGKNGKSYGFTWSFKC